MPSLKKRRQSNLSMGPSVMFRSGQSELITKTLPSPTIKNNVLFVSLDLHEYKARRHDHACIRKDNCVRTDLDKPHEHGWTMCSPQGISIRKLITSLCSAITHHAGHCLVAQQLHDSLSRRDFAIKQHSSRSTGRRLHVG